MVFNLSKHIIDESIHVKFDEDSYSKEFIVYYGSILDDPISSYSPESHIYVDSVYNISLSSHLMTTI